MSEKTDDLRSQFSHDAWELEEKYAERKNQPKTPTDGFGLCGCCANFQFAETEHTIVMAKCEAHEIILYDGRPIKNCSAHHRKGGLSLSGLAQIATFIDVPKKKAGFHTEGENEPI